MADKGTWIGTVKRTGMALATVTLLAVTLPASAQTDIARWNFTQTVAVVNNPAPTTNKTTASATSLGMASFSNGNGAPGTVTCDVTSTTGDPNPLASGFAWRVRGSNNGWSLSAPQYTQGAEFDVSTVGFSNIVLSFDWFCTTQGIKNLQVQYNTNINNTAGWTNFTGTFGGNVATVKDASNNTQLVATANNYNTPGTNVTANTIDFVANAIVGVANNPNFGVRLVSAFDPDDRRVLRCVGRDVQQHLRQLALRPDRGSGDGSHFGHGPGSVEPVPARHGRPRRRKCLPAPTGCRLEQGLGSGFRASRGNAHDALNPSVWRQRLAGLSSAGFG